MAEMPVDLTLEYYVAKLPPGGGAKLTELDLSRQLAAGRVTGAEMVRRVETGTLRRQDLCWRQGMTGWMEIGQVFETVLGAADTPAGPPPLPESTSQPPVLEGRPSPPMPAPASVPMPKERVKDTRWLALVVVVFWWLLTLLIVLVGLAVVVALLRWALR